MNPLTARAAAALAGIFRDEHEIVFLLADAGYPSAQIPPAGGLAPAKYWRMVLSEVENGIIPPEELARRQAATGEAAVLQQALLRRPANRELKALCDEARALDAGPAAAAAPAGVAKILVVGAVPDGNSSLRVNRELKAIRAAVRGPAARVKFDVDDHMSTEPVELLRVLRAARPVVLHFSGHSEMPPGATDGALVLEGPNGEPTFLPADVLARALKLMADTGSRVQAVVLNACASEAVARRLGAHADVVVCTKHAVADAVALAFAAGFYEGLAEGLAVGLAVERGRVQALLSRPGGGPRGGESAWAGGPDPHDVDNVFALPDSADVLNRLHVPRPGKVTFAP